MACRVNAGRVGDTFRLIMDRTSGVDKSWSAALSLTKKQRKLKVVGKSGRRRLDI